MARERTGDAKIYCTAASSDWAASRRRLIERAEESSVNRRACDCDDVSRFCRAFYDDTTHYAHFSVTISDTERSLRHPPKSYESMRSWVVEQYS